MKVRIRSCGVLGVASRLISYISHRIARFHDYTCITLLSIQNIWISVLGLGLALVRGVLYTHLDHDGIQGACTSAQEVRS